MKKIYYILIALIIFSCKNETSKSLDTNDLIVEDDIDMLYEVSSNKNISYDTFTTERLQDYYDLLVLKQKHPEFIKSIKEQFKVLTNDSLPKTTFEGQATINNVIQIGKTIKVSDSIKKIQLKFDVINNNITKTDTIFAIITSKEISIDGDIQISNKIKFTKN